MTIEMPTIGKVTSLSHAPKVRAKKLINDDRKKTQKNKASDKEIDEERNKKSGKFIDEIV